MFNNSITNSTEITVYSSFLSTTSFHFLINFSTISSGRNTTSEYTSPNFTHSISSKVLMTCTRVMRISNTASLLPMQFRGPPEKGRYVYGFMSEMFFGAALTYKIKHVTYLVNAL